MVKKNFTSYRSYYVQSSPYSNSYHLFWSWNLLQLDGLQKITRQEAIRLVMEERNRRKYNKEFSGDADIAIYPYGVEIDKTDIRADAIPYPYIVEKEATK